VSEATVDVPAKPSVATTARPRVTALLYFLSALPLLSSVVLIYQNGVNVPMFDEWDDSCVMLAKYKTGTLRPADLLRPQMEHRPLIPRLIELSTNVLISNNRRVHMMISPIIVAFTSLLILRLARQTIPERAALLWLIANVLLFSTVQHENWLWGEQYEFFITVFFVVAAITVTYSTLRFWPNVLSGMALWFAAVNCFAAGFAAAPAIAGVQLLHLKATRRNKLLVAALWAVAFVVVLKLYRVEPEGIHHGFAMSLREDPSRFIEYVVRYYSTPFQLFNAPTAIVSRVGVTVLAFGLIVLVRGVLSRQQFQRVLPWVGLAVFSLATALATANARLNMGTFQAMQSRYTTYSLLFVLGVMFTFAITISRGPWVLRWALNSLAGFLLGIHLITATYGVVQMKGTRETLMKSAEALRRINADPTNNFLLHLYPDLDRLRVMANEYARLGVIEPVDPAPASAPVR
jgi:hypothetical protein